MPMPFHDASLFYSLSTRQPPSGSPSGSPSGIRKAPIGERSESRAGRREYPAGDVILLGVSAGSFLLTAGYLAYAMVMRFA